MEGASEFAEAGGGKLRYVPCLNARDDHIDFLAGLIERNVGGWPEASAAGDQLETEEDLEQMRTRAASLGAEN